METRTKGMPRPTSSPTPSPVSLLHMGLSSSAEQSPVPVPATPQFNGVGRLPAAAVALADYVLGVLQELVRRVALSY